MSDQPGLGFGLALVAGANGGILATLVGHPFETVKVRYQMGQTQNIFKGLYNGVLSPLVGVTPFWAASYCGYQGARSAGFTSNGPFDVLARGVSAGLAGAVVRCPVDAVKCVAQSERTSSANALAILYKREGIRGVFRGMGPTTMWMCPAGVVFYGSYDLWTRWLAPRVDPPLFASFLAGGLAGVCEWLLCLPLDTIKTRYQAGTHSSVVECIKDTLKDQGIKGLYRGFVPTMLRAFPANGAAFFGIEGTNMLARRYYNTGNKTM